MVVTCPYCDQPSPLEEEGSDLASCPLCHGLFPPIIQPSKVPRVESPSPHLGAYVLGTFAVTALGVFLFLMLTRAEGRRALGFGSPEITLQAWQLLEAYQTNPARADETYRNRRLQITGRLEKKGWDAAGTRYVFLAPEPETMLGVQCLFSGRDDQFEDLLPGQSVTIDGTCLGKDGNVVLRDCKIAAH